MAVNPNPKMLKSLLGIVSKKWKSIRSRFFLFNGFLHKNQCESFGVFWLIHPLKHKDVNPEKGTIFKRKKENGKLLFPSSCFRGELAVCFWGSASTVNYHINCLKLGPIWAITFAADPIGAMGRRVNQQPYNPGLICAAKKRSKSGRPLQIDGVDLTEKGFAAQKHWVLFNKKQPNFHRIAEDFPKHKRCSTTIVD